MIWEFKIRFEMVLRSFCTKCAIPGAIFLQILKSIFCHFTVLNFVVLFYKQVFMIIK